MGEARRRRFRVINGGKSAPPPPPRLVNVTIQLDEPSYRAVERERAHVGIEGQSDFYTFLMGAGLGAVEVQGFVPAFRSYVAHMDGVRAANPEVPLPTIQTFTRALIKAGMLAHLQSAKKGDGVAMPRDEAGVAGPEKGPDAG